MPKKPRDVQKENVAVAKAKTRNGNGKMERTSSIAGRKKSSSRKTLARKPERLRQQSSLKSNVNTTQPLPSDEQIRLRAYFIAEKRTQLSLPGDDQSDWLEAKRQLFDEAGIPLN